MKRTLSLAIGVAILAGGRPASAITDIEVNASIPFNLANPGARSMGMGGAFVGLADDATAAYTNPAGLTQLVAPEVSVEARHTAYSLPHASSGSAILSPFNGSGIKTADADNSKNNISFLSVVYPHDRWSFAFYRNELVNYSSNAKTSLDGISVIDASTNSLIGQTFPETEVGSLKIVDYGLSAAWKASDSLSLGIGLSYYQLDINTSLDRVTYNGLKVYDASGLGHLLPAGTPLSEQRQFGGGDDLSINLGARLALNDQVSFGFNYRRGPNLEYEATNAALTNILFNDDGSVTLVPLSSPEVVSDLKNVRFKVPDEFGAGLSWRPNERWVVNFDVDYIQYSQLTHGIVSLFGNDSAVVSKLSIPNGAEIHFGGEYTFTQFAHPFSIRAGVWHDPRHSIEFKGDPGNDLNSAALATLFSGGQGSQTHGAVGFGWAFSKFEIDGAADFATVTDTYSISGIYRF